MTIKDFVGPMVTTKITATVCLPNSLSHHV